MTAGSDIGNGCASSLTGQAVVVAQPGQQRPPGRIGKRRKRAVQSGRLDT